MSELDWKTTSELESPCYDVKTKTDCPDRCGGCQLNCPKWKAYEAKRDELYKQRMIDREARSVIEETKCDLHTKHVKKQMRLKRMYR